MTLNIFNQVNKENFSGIPNNAIVLKDGTDALRANFKSLERKPLKKMLWRWQADATILFMWFLEDMSKFIVTPRSTTEEAQLIG